MASRSVTDIDRHPPRARRGQKRRRATTPDWEDVFVRTRPPPRRKRKTAPAPDPEPESESEPEPDPEPEREPDEPEARSRMRRTRRRKTADATSTDGRSMIDRLRALREGLPPALQRMVDEDDGGRTPPLTAPDAGARRGRRAELRAMGFRSLGDRSAGPRPERMDWSRTRVPREKPAREPRPERMDWSRTPVAEKSKTGPDRMDVDSGDDLPARRKGMKTSAQIRRYWDRLDPPADGDENGGTEPAPPRRKAFKKNGRHPTERNGGVRALRPRKAEGRPRVVYEPGLDVKPKKYEWHGGGDKDRQRRADEGGLYARLAKTGAYGKALKIRQDDAASDGDVQARLAQIARTMRARV